MKLVSFPGYTCGGIICDILNLESSQVGTGNNIVSPTHNRAKIFTENWHTGTGFDVNEFYEKINNFRSVKRYAEKNERTWIGTHCSPTEFNTDIFENILNITTENRLSKIYRHTRVFYTTLSGQFPDYIFKRNSLKPHRINQTPADFNQPFVKVFKPNIINLEFQDVVEFTDTFQQTILQIIGKEFEHHMHKRMAVWREINPFLFDDRINYIFKLWEKENL